MQENGPYDPFAPAIKFARTQLERADDPSYLINYWNAIGTLPNKSIPHPERVDKWDKDL